MKTDNLRILGQSKSEVSTDGQEGIVIHNLKFVIDN